MSEFRLSPEAEAELDAIWIHIARDSGSIDIATHVVEGITERFGCWPGIHTSDGAVTMIWVLVCVVYPRTTTSSFIVLGRTALF